MRILSKPLTLSARQITVLKILIHIGLLGLLLGYFYNGVTDNLGADPVKALLHFTGISAVNLLLATLLISPLAKTLPAPFLMRFRRMVGVYVFVFAFVHLLTYISFELQFDWSLVISEIIKRPYITVGMVALVLLLVLTITSPNKIRQKLGKRWQSLHNSIYLILFLSLLHFTWSRKTGLQEPLIYWILALAIMGPRVMAFVQRRKNARKRVV